MRALSREEQALFDEMKERCLAKGQYKDEKAKDKFKMLCHLEDFEVQYWELQQENKQLKERIRKAIEYIESKNNGHCIINGEEKGAFTFILNFDVGREFI